MKKNIDPRVANEVAAKQQAGLLRSANMVTSGKHNGSKKKKTLKFLSHRLNNQVHSFMSGYNG